MGRKSYYELGLDYETNYYMAHKKQYEEHEPLYMYHVSHKPIHPEDHSSFEMRPKGILSGEVHISSIKRICVAPTIEQCLVAVVGSTNDYYYVYRTVTKASKTVPAFGVMDAPLTQERWFCRPRKFMLCAMIPASLNKVLPRDDCDDELYGIYINFGGDRGSEDSFYTQRTELYRLRSYFKKHDHNYFINKLEKKRHDNQKQMKLRLNRYEPNAIYTSSAN